MALYTKKGKDIPKDAVRLDEEGALRYMKTIIDSWGNTSDTFYIRNGSSILSGITALSGIYYNNYYRERLRLGHFGRVSTYLPIIVIPSVLNFLAQTTLVQYPIMIEKYSCPVCMEMRSVSIQLLTGVLYPLTMAPLAGFMMASRHCTYNVPMLSRDPKGVWNLFKKLSKPIKGITLGIVVMNLAAGSFISYKEATSVATVKYKLMQLEEAYETRAIE